MSFGDVTAFPTSAGLPRSADTAEVTTLGSPSKAYIPGLKDGTIPIEGPVDVTIDGYLSGILAMIRPFEYNPQGTTTGLPSNTGNCILTSYEPSSPVDDASTFSGEFQLTGDVIPGAQLNPRPQRSHGERRGSPGWPHAPAPGLSWRRRYLPWARERQERRAPWRPTAPTGRAAPIPASRPSSRHPTPGQRTSMSPELGGKVKVIGPTKRQQVDIRREAMVGGEADPEKVQQYIWREGVIEPRFPDDQLGALFEKNAGTVDRVLAVVLRLSGMEEGSVKEKEKTFVREPDATTRIRVGGEPPDRQSPTCGERCPGTNTPGGWRSPTSERRSARPQRPRSKRGRRR